MIRLTLHSLQHTLDLLCRFLLQSTSFSSALIQNPDWDEVRALRRWFSTVGAQLVQQNQTNALSAQRQGGQWQRGRWQRSQREHSAGCGASNLRDCPPVRFCHGSPPPWPRPHSCSWPSDSGAWLDQLPLSSVSDLQSLKQKYAETMQPLAQPVTFKVGARRLRQAQ